MDFDYLKLGKNRSLGTVPLEKKSSGLEKEWRGDRSILVGRIRRLVGYEMAQLLPAALGSVGGLGLKGSCGKTNDPGSWAGFGDSGLVWDPCAAPLWEALFL